MSKKGVKTIGSPNKPAPFSPPPRPAPEPKPRGPSPAPERPTKK